MENTRIFFIYVHISEILIRTKKIREKCAQYLFMLVFGLKYT